MGVFGSIGGSIGGNILGGAIGAKLGGKKGRKLGEKYGALAGGAGGALLPFEKGGVVPGRRGNPLPILAHSGEVILSNRYPALQRSALAEMNRLKAKEKGHTVFTRKLM